VRVRRAVLWGGGMSLVAAAWLPRRGRKRSGAATTPVAGPLWGRGGRAGSRIAPRVGPWRAVRRAGTAAAAQLSW